VSRKLGTTKPPPGDNALISEIVRRLVDVYRPERIYLFGSAARGDAGPDSDYDRCGPGGSLTSGSTSVFRSLPRL
jgi:hypothetical protein